jgi:O-succinylbenzoic acid--CoA ligase
VAGAMVLVRSLLADSQPVVLNTNVPFDAEGFARTAGFMTGERRFSSLVPAQLDRLAASLETVPGLLHVLQKFTAILVGGQAANSKTVEQLRDLGVNIVITYGMAETCGGVVYNGVPLDGFEVSVRDDGRIQIGEFTPNDLGEFVNGKLLVRGRADRVLISGGHKLSLEAVEAWTLTQDDVSAAAAVIVENVKFGESFICFYVGTTASSIDSTVATKTLGIVAKSGRWQAIEKIPALPNGKPDLQALTVLANQVGVNRGQE